MSIEVVTLTKDELQDMFRQAFLFAQRQTDNEWMTKRELSKYLKWSPSKIERKMSEGLPFTGGKGEHPRFRKSDVDAWLASNL
jgi:excisionase family DNA binding protein